MGCKGHGVSIHAPAWGATRGPFRGPAGGRVSIHAPAWGATTRDIGTLDSINVSIHAPAWGATLGTKMALRIQEFQFTLPRGERPKAHHHHRDCHSFNSRSRVGSDGGSPRTLRLPLSFNSRSRVGSDVLVANAKQRDLVSIHAPAWGATDSRAFRAVHLLFQFTLPRGERRLLGPGDEDDEEFQFTLPRGERLVSVDEV